MLFPSRAGKPLDFPSLCSVATPVLKEVFTLMRLTLQEVFDCDPFSGYVPKTLC